MSALDGWGFTLTQFAMMYADKFGVDKEKMIKKLWGDNYFDAEAKKWTCSAISSAGKTLSRAFCKFVLDPIGQIIHASMNNEHDKLERMLKSLNVTLSEDELLLAGKSLMKKIMKKWLPLSTIVLETMVNCLPSPVQAQKYRTELLYTGPQDDITAEAMRQCNPQGPLELYVFTMIPHGEKGRFRALGRVFSGTIHTGQSVRIIEPSHNPSNNQDANIQKIGQVLLPIGREVVEVESVGPGNLCLLSGLDNYIISRATLTSDETSYPVLMPTYGEPYSPVRYSVQPENPADLPKLLKGLKHMQSHYVQVTIEETGEIFMAVHLGYSELQIQIFIQDMEDQFMEGGKIKISGPIIAYKETVISESSQVCMAKSPNKHNRLYVTAEPLQDGLPEALLENRFVFKTQDILVNDFGWKEEQVKKIWCFGEKQRPSNIMMDSTNSILNVGEIKDHVCTAFQWVVGSGVLAEENVRGVRMNLVDAVLHSDAIHRGGGQIIPTARRAFFGAMLTAQPRLMEPMLMVDVHCPENVLGGVYLTMNKRRGIILESVPKVGTSMITVKVHLPVEESIGFTADLRSNTSGQAIPQMSVSHYCRLIHDDPLENGTRANEIVKSIRRRKGLNEDVPPLSRFLDT